MLRTLLAIASLAALGGSPATALMLASATADLLPTNTSGRRIPTSGAPAMLFSSLAEAKVTGTFATEIGRSVSAESVYRSIAEVNGIGSQDVGFSGTHAYRSRFSTQGDPGEVYEVRVDVRRRGVLQVRDDGVGGGRARVGAATAEVRVGGLVQSTVVGGQTTLDRLGPSVHPGLPPVTGLVSTTTLSANRSMLLGEFSGDQDFVVDYIWSFEMLSRDCDIYHVTLPVPPPINSVRVPKDCEELLSGGDATAVSQGLPTSFGLGSEQSVPGVVFRATLVAVPEPASAALLVAGLAGLAAQRRRH